MTTTLRLQQSVQGGVPSNPPREATPRRCGACTQVRHTIRANKLPAERSKQCPMYGKASMTLAERSQESRGDRLVAEHDARPSPAPATIPSYAAATASSVIASSAAASSAAASSAAASSTATSTSRSVVQPTAVAPSAHPAISYEDFWSNSLFSTPSYRRTTRVMDINQVVSHLRQQQQQQQQQQM
ncbi:hypothetical protein C8Q73DRAFT_669103 [Cubamyces lactineus]|nr:hypothetical protein C8Q73DRAFT_669103 [Cubamyces lactineus]